MTFVKQLEALVAFRESNPERRPDVVRLCITERYARRTLRLRAKDELMYKGIKVLCMRASKQRANAQSKQAVK